jgi:MoxR-like ATPase
MDINQLERLLDHLYKAAQTPFRRPKVGEDGRPVLDAAGVPVEERVDRYVPLLIWGEAGIGKSETVKRFARSKGIDFRDLKKSKRHSELALDTHIQNEHSLSGVAPVKDVVEAISSNRSQDTLAHALELIESVPTLRLRVTERTVHAPPSWFPQPRTKGVLFLDEINRGQKDVRQAIFQLILDREMYDLVLPNGWIIVSAVNPTTGAQAARYDVLPIDDKAFVTRFLHVALVPTVDEWLDYAHNSDVDPTIINAIAASRWLPGKGVTGAMSFREGERRQRELSEAETLLGLMPAELPSTLMPTPRTWTMLSKLLPDLDKDLRDPVAQGLVGKKAAMLWIRLQNAVEAKRVVTAEEIAQSKDYQRDIRPRLQALAQGFSTVEDEEDAEKHQDRMADMAALAMVIEDVTEYLTHEISKTRKMSAQEAFNFGQFIVDMYHPTDEGGLGMQGITFAYMKYWPPHVFADVCRRESPVYEHLFMIAKDIATRTGKQKFEVMTGPSDAPAPAARKSRRPKLEGEPFGVFERPLLSREVQHQQRQTIPLPWFMRERSLI